jgi:hypothetical protein
MLEGIEHTIYGSEASEATRLVTLGNSVSVAAAIETPLTDTKAFEFGYLVYMRADCTVVGTTAGYWKLRCGIGAAPVLHLQQALPAAPVGSSLCWPFPVPWKNAHRADIFTLEPSVATMGTWIFIVNGFYSTL